MIRTLGWALGAGALTLAGAASAQSGPVQLVWSAPEHCPGEEEVRKRVERILNRPPAVADGQQLTISAVVTPASSSQPWSVTLETDDGAGQRSRTVKAASCDELANATALFVAILVEPDFDEAPAPETSSPAALLPAPPNAERPKPSVGVAADTTTSSWSLGGAGGARSALLPDWTFGLALYGAFSWRAVRSSAGVSAWLPSRETLDASEQGAELQLSSAFAELCLQTEAGALAPALCSGGELALLRGQGFGVGVEPKARSAAFVSLSAGAALSLRQSEQLRLVLDVDAVFPLGERQFVFAGADPAVVYVPGAGFRLSCGAEWSL
jgi:hypothetical protein